MPLYHFPIDPQEDVPIEKRYRFWNKKLGKDAYYYHDTPDGQDMFKKLGAITRDTAIISLIGGWIYGKEALHNKSNLLALVETFKVATPPVLAAATFALFSNTLAKAEGRSGHHNYFLSGFASGVVWSLGFKHNFYTGLGRALFFGLLAAGWYQMRVVEGHKIVPDALKTHVFDRGYPRSREIFNWSLVEDVPKRDW